MFDFRKQAWLLLCALLWALTPCLWAGGSQLTWEDCLQELITTHPELEAAREALVKARSDVRAAYAPFLPQISASAGATKSHTEQETGSQESTSYNINLTASQNLFSGFHDQALLRQSRALLSAAEMNFQISKATLSYNLTQAFARLLYAQEFIQLAETISARRRENVNLVEMRFAAGRENKGSFLRSKAYYRQALFETTQSQRDIKVAQQQMAVALGRRDGSGIIIAGLWETNIPPAAPDFRELAQHSPEYQQAAAQLEATHQNVRLAASDFYPQWSISGTIGRRDSEHIIPEQEYWSIGTALSYPLFTGGRSWYALRGAQAMHRAAAARLIHSANQLAAALEEKFAAWQDAMERMDVQAEFLQAAEVRSTIAHQQYQNGLLSFEDWDLIENDLIDRQKTMLASQRDAILARAAWEKALGVGSIP